MEERSSTTFSSSAGRTVAQSRHAGSSSSISRASSTLPTASPGRAAALDSDHRDVVFLPRGLGPQTRVLLRTPERSTPRESLLSSPRPDHPLQLRQRPSERPARLESPQCRDPRRRASFETAGDRENDPSAPSRTAAAGTRPRRALRVTDPRPFGRDIRPVRTPASRSLHVCFQTLVTALCFNRVPWPRRIDRYRGRRSCSSAARPIKPR